ncbi:major facilitator superfamily domain-containing protein [Helicostylum pulchrum]|nr:major facilitator superfamily domain-containing protein [Helicostylum pulchrum]
MRNPEKTEFVSSSAFMDPIDSRPGTSSSHVRQSLLIDNLNYHETLGTPLQCDIDRRDSSKRQQQLYFNVMQHPKTFWRWIKRKMAFKPTVSQDPRLFSKRKKQLILACLAAGSSLNGFCSTVYFPSIPDIRNELNAPDIGITLVSSLFILFGGLGPILWASMSDYYHIRRFLYLISLLIFIAASIGCALINNIWLLVVLRCIQSVGTSVTMSVGAGTVSDCWQITERGSAFSFLFVGQFLGPLIGPIIGGGVTTSLGWRSVFWICAGYGIFLFVFLFLFFPETYRLDIQWDQSFTQLQSQTTFVDLSATPKSTIEEEEPERPKFNPLQSLFMLKYLFVCLVAIEIGFCFGTMFTLETLIPDLYYIHYGFDSWQTGLSFIGAGIGNVLGSIVSGRLSDYLLVRSCNQRDGISKPEDRLTLNTWPGGFILVPLGVLLFGWSIMANFSVWPAIIGFSILCFGMSQVYTAGSAYAVDSVPGKGASVTAACNLFRMTMAAILSMVSPIMGSELSIGYVSILLASLNVVGMCLLVYVKYKGVHLRRRAGLAKYK